MQAPGRCACHALPRARTALSRSGSPSGASRRCAYAAKSAISSPRGTLVRPGKTASVVFAVRGEAHVVEHDLVEPGVCRRRRDPERVVPDAAIVGVHPAEACARLPDGSVRAPNREVGSRLGKHRILEDDDPADQIDAVPVRKAGDLRGLVVRADGTDLGRQRDARRTEADLAALVLDVELDRVEPALAEVDVLLELPGKRRERAGDVHAAHLDGQRTRADGRGEDRRRARCRRLRLRGSRVPVLSGNRHASRERRERSGGACRGRARGGGAWRGAHCPVASETARSGPRMGRAWTPGPGGYRTSTGLRETARHTMPQSRWCSQTAQSAA